MESSDGASVVAANPPEKSSNARSSLAFDTPSSVAFDTPSSLAFDLLRGAFSRRGGALMDSGKQLVMQIILFPANIDKFTGFSINFRKVFLPQMIVIKRVVI